MADEISLKDFYERFPDNEACWHHLRRQRWGEDAFECPACGEDNHWGLLQTRNLFECYECGRQTSITAGTVLEDTKLDLHTWFLAAFLILTTKKGLSTLELARKIDVSDRTAWFVHHTITTVIGKAQARELFGTIEADETRIGGQDRSGGGGPSNQDYVFGLVEQRDDELGRVRLQRIDVPDRETLHGHIVEAVQPGSQVRTDRWRAYLELDQHQHDRAAGDLPNGSERYIPRIHVVFANLATQLGGTHAWSSDRHLQAYLDLFAYRFNHRDRMQEGFKRALGLLVSSKPVRWEGLVGGVN